MGSEFASGLREKWKNHPPGFTAFWLLPLCTFRQSVDRFHLRCGNERGKRDCGEGHYAKKPVEEWKWKTTRVLHLICWPKTFFRPASISAQRISVKVDRSDTFPYLQCQWSATGKRIKPSQSWWWLMQFHKTNYLQLCLTHTLQGWIQEDFFQEELHHYFSTNKPHRFFLCRIPLVLESPRSWA